MELTRPSWTFGLTDYELAQAALAAFGGKGEEIQYDYRAAGMIQGIFIAATFLLFFEFVYMQYGFSVIWVVFDCDGNIKAKTGI